MIIQASRIIPMIGPIIEDGAVRVEAETITYIGTALELIPEPGETVLDLGRAVLCPGFVNAHCHLDYTCFRGSIARSNSFTEWIKSINALKRQFTPEDFLESINDGARMLLRSGTTSVANIAAFPELLSRLPEQPLRVWWFMEMMDVRSRLNNDDALFGALSFFDQRPGRLSKYGLSPHAPYTASIELYRLAKRCSMETGMLFTTHIAESIEEHEMFVHARGPLYEFLEKLGRENSDCGHGSPLSHLIEHGVLTSACLAVHLNYLEDYDMDALAQSGASVIHCPKCHTYFGHNRFPMKDLRTLGINICLGTDSLASNNSLDMRSEIREARNLNPGISDHDWMAMATLNGALALGEAGHLGQLSAGALADMAAYAWDGAMNPYATVIESKKEPLMVMVNGDIMAGTHSQVLPLIVPPSPAPVESRETDAARP
ncbi:MAG: amidohydrolase family protein [Candidatus Methylacidiphilales bacterium]|nr:amidohydrolase family protein [Candidatus Methylacidiphilales bacterium]